MPSATLLTLFAIRSNGRHMKPNKKAASLSEIKLVYAAPSHTITDLERLGVLGSAAQVAIYTKHWEHLSLLRKILLRMRSWQNYVFTEGH